MARKTKEERELELYINMLEEENKHEQRYIKLANVNITLEEKGKRNVRRKARRNNKTK